MLMSFQPFIFSRGAAVRGVSKDKAVEAFGPPSTTFGAYTLAGFTVITEEIVEQR